MNAHTETNASGVRPADPVIVGIGEALFDVFDGEARLGGAPLNVAVHAHRLLRDGDGDGGGGAGVVVSRVGRDALGDRIERTLFEEGTPVDFLQRDPRLETGRVTVEKHDASNGGGHTFHIERDAAWDEIAWDEGLAALAAQASAVAFGSLAQREAVSRATIQRFVAQAHAAIRLFDVNLRSSDGTDFFDADVLRRGCELANYVKLNDEELDTVNALTGTGSAESLREAFGLEAVIFTRGAKGTAAYTADGLVEGETAEAERRHPDADTVGAGDSCSAALLAALTTGRDLQTALDFANRVAAFVAHQPGATPRLPASIRL
ncbi:MAG: PfkB family carbohydrate kinase [Planctomycetota bacterium]